MTPLTFPVANRKVGNNECQVEEKPMYKSTIVRKTYNYGELCCEPDSWDTCVSFVEDDVRLLRSIVWSDIPPYEKVMVIAPIYWGPKITRGFWGL